MLLTFTMLKKAFPNGIKLLLDNFSKKGICYDIGTILTRNKTTIEERSWL
jgi:hypothetical protein